MACQGPDLKTARKLGRKKANEFLKIIAAEGIIGGVKPFQKNFNDAKRRFKKALEDLYEADCCCKW